MTFSVLGFSSDIRIELQNQKLIKALRNGPNNQVTTT